MNVPRLLIAGTHSGCGKTAVAAGVIRALSRRGMRVQPYKVGPDFLDPPYLAAAAGRPCRTLDGWMLPQSTLVEVYVRGASGADAAVIEGMMGLYDGAGSAGDEGSTAEVARWLAAPVILVVDVAASARSAAATALGFAAFDPGLNIAGVIANRAGGPRHIQAVRDALAASGIPLLGVLPTTPDFAVAERHLGFLPPGEGIVEMLADAVAEAVDLDALLRVARTAPPVVMAGAPVFPPMPLGPVVRVAVARDEAFSAVWQDALELLEAYGAALVPFSPLRDAAPPPADGIYLGGGHPEAFAAELAANASMRRAIASAVREGVPVYAEGGGLAYLMERVAGGGGAHPMAGALPGVATMHEPPAPVSAVTLEALDDSLLLRRGESVRAYEFHHRTVALEQPVQFAYRSKEGRGIEAGYDGIRLPGGVASYAQVHLASHPAMASRFVDACRRMR